MFTDMQIGSAMFVVGFFLTTYHASHLFIKKNITYSHLAWMMFGVGCFQIGSNLTADAVHDKLKVRRANNAPYP